MSVDSHRSEDGCCIGPSRAQRVAYRSTFAIDSAKQGTHADGQHSRGPLELPAASDIATKSEIPSCIEPVTTPKMGL